MLITRTEEIRKCYHVCMAYGTCVIDGCTKKRVISGHCVRHANENTALDRCSQDGCRNAAQPRIGLCSAHRQSLSKPASRAATLRGTTCTYPGCSGSVRKHVPFCQFHIKANVKLKGAYGITLEDKIRMSEACGGRCQSCGDVIGIEALVVDHCHTTGVVRGLLCGPCNRAIGLMRDEPMRLRAAARYLEGAPEC